MALVAVGGAITSCDCGTRPSILLILPIEFSLDFSLDLPTINFSFDLQVPSLNLELDFTFNLSFGFSLDFSFEFPSIQFGFAFDLDLDLDLDLPSFDLDLDLPFFDFSLALPSFNLDLHLPSFDLDLDLSLPTFGFDLDFSFDLNISGGFVINMPMATIKNHIPYLNIVPFGMCKSSGNPAVAAAMGAPQPCTPMTFSPWEPGATTVLLQGQPVLDDTSTLKCAFGSVIKIVFAGQTSVFVP
jgi:hypothetical protein